MGESEVAIGDIYRRRPDFEKWIIVKDVRANMVHYDAGNFRIAGTIKLCTTLDRFKRVYTNKPLRTLERDLAAAIEECRALDTGWSTE